MSLLDDLLDRFILLSFDRLGYLRHRRLFDPHDLHADLAGRVCLVTGANAGLGRATASALAALGAEVWLLCRSRARGEHAVAEIRRDTPAASLRLETVDLADLASVRGLAARLPCARVDVLINNAGVLPSTYQPTRDGLELTLATNLVGPFLLTMLLVPRLVASNDGRVITVSSGGMYSQRLDVAALSPRPDDPFDGVAAYARTKRAEVVLTELWHEQLAGRGITFSSMHPGWADTPGVRTSLPRFRALTQWILRTPEEGADTIVWLAAAERLRGQGGRFWFDRRAVTTHLLSRTQESPAERGRLWQALLEWSRLTPPELNGALTGR